MTQVNTLRAKIKVLESLENFVEAHDLLKKVVDEVVRDDGVELTTEELWAWAMDQADLDFTIDDGESGPDIIDTEFEDGGFMVSSEPAETDSACADPECGGWISKGEDAWKIETPLDTTWACTKECADAVLSRQEIGTTGREAEDEAFPH